jgi:hypothetical protein
MTFLSFGGVMHKPGLLLLTALCALTACSKGASNTRSSAVGEPASAAAQTTAASGGNAQVNPCDRAIAAADVAGILVAPATRDSGPDPDTCVFRTQTRANVTISVAKGDAAKFAWTLATTYNGTKNPLAGVGDEALFNPNGTTLIARKGDTSCRLDVVGYDNANAMDDITKDRGETLARKLGGVCNKVFAAH